VGINTAIIMGAQGISFSVPIDTAAWVVGELIARGRVRRGWLGIAGQNRPLPRDQARALGIVQPTGVEVNGLEERGPSVASGLKVGDIIIRLDGGLVVSIDDLHRALQKWPIERALRLRVLRDRKIAEIEVTPAEAPP
jgi:S1-C subfamily serine protease